MGVFDTPASLHITIRVGAKGIEVMIRGVLGIMTRDALGILVTRDMTRTGAISVDRGRVLLLLPEIPYNLLLMSLILPSLLDIRRFLKLPDPRR